MLMQLTLELPKNEIKNKFSSQNFVSFEVQNSSFLTCFKKVIFDMIFFNAFVLFFIPILLKAQEYVCKVSICY